MAGENPSRYRTQRDTGAAWLIDVFTTLDNSREASAISDSLSSAETAFTRLAELYREETRDGVYRSGGDVTVKKPKPLDAAYCDLTLSEARRIRSVGENRNSSNHSRACALRAPA